MSTPIVKCGTKKGKYEMSKDKKTTIEVKGAAITYANEADLLNVALSGQTAKQWRDANPRLEGNMRDFASIEQLLVLANIEGMKAKFIHMSLTRGDRLKRLNEIAIRQMKTLTVANTRALEDGSPSMPDEVGSLK